MMMQQKYDFMPQSGREYYGMILLLSYTNRKTMKRNFFNQALKPTVMVILISLVFSSCSVTYRERHRRPPPPRERVIIRP
jgi:hypothetical protein